MGLSGRRGVGVGPAAGAATLSSLQWQYRVIAVFAPDSGRASEARHTLVQAKPDITERDIAWFVITADNVQSNIDAPIDRGRLRALHQAGGFEAVLVGKDGGVKARQRDALDLAALFARIDKMPMRQQEMRQE